MERYRAKLNEMCMPTRDLDIFDVMVSYYFQQTKQMKSSTASLSAFIRDELQGMPYYRKRRRSTRREHGKTPCSRALSGRCSCLRAARPEARIRGAIRVDLL